MQEDEDAIRFKQNRTDRVQRGLVGNLDEDESEQPVGIRVRQNQRTC